MINDKTRLLFNWLAKERKTIYNIYALSILQGVLYITIPLTIQGIITYTMAGRFSASLTLLSVLTILVTFFIGVLQLWQMRLNETIQENVFCNLTGSVSKLPEGSIELKDKIAHFFEVVTLQKGIGKILLEFSFSVISIIFGLLLLPAYSSWFMIFSVFLGFVFYLIVSYYGKKAQEANIDTSTQKYRIFDSLKAGEMTESRLNVELSDYLKYRKRYYKTFESQYKGILFFKLFFISVLLFLGTYLVQIGELNIGQFVASEIIILLVINSVEKLVGSLGTCYDIITALYKIELLFKSNPNYSFLNSAKGTTQEIDSKIYKYSYPKILRWIIYTVLISCLIILFLPWTQSITMSGQVSVLNPENKPQQVTSRIAGRIEKWFINDGQYVKRNDTIAFISEVKEEYMDSLLIQRSESQVKAKEVTLQSYSSKIDAVNRQIDALNKALRLKTEQVKNKVQQAKAKLSADSADVVASQNNYKVAEEQMKRFEELLTKGVISRTELENRKVKMQEAFAKKISAENKFIATKSEVINAELDLQSTVQEYNEKLMKAESEKFSTMSLFYDGEGSLSKLQNQLSNYSLRSSYYYVLAPQDGYIHNMAIQGVGEIVKEGGVLCNIAPETKEQAVELYIEPFDLPLIQKGQEVQLIFDGWPAFVFSGWPGMSYGSFTAEIVSFDRVISPNGKFRVLAVSKNQSWPEAIQIGGGCKGFALLRNVPVIYELWRKVNGFPPEFYKPYNPIHEKDIK
jgi:multidrug resistance efflux pump